MRFGRKVCADERRSLYSSWRQEPPDIEMLLWRIYCRASMLVLPIESIFHQLESQAHHISSRKLRIVRSISYLKYLVILFKLTAQ